jgi:Flp pilus assembly CpaF family ATPase
VPRLKHVPHVDSVTLELDSYDDLLSNAELDSRERFLKMLGPIRRYLERPNVYNVNVNEGDEGRIFVEAAGGKFEAPETMLRSEREALIGNIAGKRFAVVDRLHARLAADMPHGFDVRVQAFCPPISDWSLMLRKHAARVITLDEYEGDDKQPLAPTAEATQPLDHGKGTAALRAAIARHDNILIAGRPNAGKTTMLNACLRESARMQPDARLVVIQDRKELKPSHRDCIQIMARVEQARYESAGRIDRYEYEFSDALEDALRTGFDILAWGELRDPRSALALLMALNTGARGLATTLHADSALDALYRLEDLLHVAGALPKRQMITRFVHLIVFMEMDASANRRIGDVQRVSGVDASGDYILGRV